MWALTVFSCVLVAVVAQQHPAHVNFDPNTHISQLHETFLANFPTPEPPHRKMPLVPIVRAPVTARPVQQGGLLAGHLAGHQAPQQVPHRFNEPITKWEGPFAHEFGAGVKGPVQHTQFTPEVLAAQKFLAQAHFTHLKQKATQL
ncbi:unnamed protein product [Meganyctiphanes norvegica]|uniref:Uncharacterized protein n=1 Tax=Meganyctiphanes norvegica TaxID=48144 RepID=A0AAV2REB7_MEGNR